MPMPVQVTSAIQILVLLLMTPGCASLSPMTGNDGSRIVRHALEFQGVPYRYGGHDPKGFDCSGLVQYVYRREGLNIPRTVREQWRQAAKVDSSDLSAGDLLFFRLPGKSWHVGIYVGQNRFIHAPSRGKTVRMDSLNAYWQHHYLGAGRYWR